MVLWNSNSPFLLSSFEVKLKPHQRLSLSYQNSPLLGGVALAGLERLEVGERHRDLTAWLARPHSGLVDHHPLHGEVGRDPLHGEVGEETLLGLVVALLDVPVYHSHHGLLLPVLRLCLCSLVLASSALI